MLTAARLLTAGTKPGNDLNNCLERNLGIKPDADHSTSDWGAMFLTPSSSPTQPAMSLTSTPSKTYSSLSWDKPV